MNKWKYYFVDLWKYYFYVRSQSGSVRINQLSKYSLDFLGYLSSVRLNTSVVRSQMLENSFIIDNAMKKLDTRIPIISLIGSLSKAKFCNTLGHPISKPTWSEADRFRVNGYSEIERDKLNLINSTYKILEQLENYKNETIHFEQQRAIHQVRQRVFQQALQGALGTLNSSLNNELHLRTISANIGLFGVMKFGAIIFSNM
ncbi:uncharacterized protein LOC111293264 [Durio zibethinus]|uniref:Uncharacterized protein LOC111293264 n=1 Tax=Durio zibethinus TaxID=66656 RepID=A0A6P5YNA7_DURZI|nr:uncharacterized protein LOC111293264 [Durio zibethinus]